MAEQSVVIKKYSDRRLYDSNARRYVNLSDIAGLVREGVDVKVIDARTGKDITGTILTQIIVDEARGGSAGLPVNLLRQLVIASDRATHEFLSSYLEGALDLYRKAETAVRSRVSGAPSPLTSPVEFVRQLLGGQAPAPPEDAGEIAELRRRVSELEARLAGRGRHKPGRKAGVR